MDPILTGIIAVAALAIIGLFTGGAEAAALDFSRAIATLKSHGFTLVPTDFNASAISLEEGPAVSTAFEWARTAQLDGLAVLVPSGIIAEHKAGHDKMVIAIDPVWVRPATESGLLVLLPKL